MAVCCAALGVIPLLVAKRTKEALALFALVNMICLIVFWAISASIVGPFFGACSITLFACWMACAGIGSDSKEFPVLLGFPVFLTILVLVIAFMSSSMVRSSDYAKMIGPIEERVWTQDVQPKSPKHIRMTNPENALYKAQNALKGEIGSQFEVAGANMTLQMIRGTLYYIVPLDFRNFGVWKNSEGVPAYVKVSAEDDDQEAELKMLPAGKKFLYTPGAYFGKNLERHLRSNGFVNIGLCDYTLEIDEEEGAWWVITTYQPTIMAGGKKVTGAVLVNPMTGESKTYDMASMPSWVDRVVPEEFVERYISWWGEYRNGYINTLPLIGDHKGLLKPVDPNLYYGSDGQPYWVTDVTSVGKDTSLTGVMYTNSKTGKSVLYKTDGGSTSEAILKAVNDNQAVKYLKLHGTNPQLYNLYGTMASVVVLLNDQHARQGVAIVSVKDIQKVAVGADIYEAVAKYQEFIGGHAKGALEKTRDMLSVAGVVERIHQEFVANGNATYQIYLRGVPHVFYGTKKLSVKLPITEKGDKVKIDYVATSEAAIPILGFENSSIDLKYSKEEKQLTEQALKNQATEKTKTDALTTSERLKSLSPKQLKQLEKHIPAAK